MTYEEDYSFARACMGPDEHILWRGKPQKGRLLFAADIFMIPFSVLWWGFAIFWLVSAIMDGAPVFFWLVGLVFVCAGFYIVIGRFLLTVWLRKRTAYVITNKKIIRRRNTKIDVLSAATMPSAQTDYYKDGCGTVRFRTEIWNGRAGYSRKMQCAGMDFESFTIENVPEINRVLQAIESMEK